MTFDGFGREEIARQSEENQGGKGEEREEEVSEHGLFGNYYINRVTINHRNGFLADSAKYQQE